MRLHKYVATYKALLYTDRKVAEIMDTKPIRKGKPAKRVKSIPVNIKVEPEVKQTFYDIADVKGLTLTALFEEMVADYANRYLGSDINVADV